MVPNLLHRLQTELSIRLHLRYCAFVGQTPLRSLFVPRVRPSTEALNAAPRSPPFRNAICPPGSHVTPNLISMGAALITDSNNKHQTTNPLTNPNTILLFPFRFSSFSLNLKIVFFQNPSRPPLFQREGYHLPFPNLCCSFNSYDALPFVSPLTRILSPACLQAGERG